jgi:tRNA (cytidine/uridine-2'-O-)-methyltransferase
VHPEIPPNTGNIGRLCAATRTPLHLIRPLGFSLQDRYLKRAGLDYWPYLRWQAHDSWEDFLAAERPPSLLLYSARAAPLYLEAPVAGSEPLYLVFGAETRGLPAELLTAPGACSYRIPILEAGVRSLNLANAVAIVLYDALRQRRIFGLA